MQLDSFGGSLQAAAWVEDELADTDEEFGDEDSEQEQIDATETGVRHSSSESAESDDEVSVGQAETEDEPTVSAPVAAQETEVIRAEPMVSKLSPYAELSGDG